MFEAGYDKAFRELLGLHGIGFGLEFSVVIDPKKVKGCSLTNVGEFGWADMLVRYVPLIPLKKLLKRRRRGMRSVLGCLLDGPLGLLIVCSIGSSYIVFYLKSIYYILYIKLN
jgi:hypothetical protein